MSSKTQYFKIGLFVIIASTLTVSAVIIFGAGFFAKEKVLFETYFDQSVQGLSVGSPVKYRGVDIGSVEEITFVNREYYLDPHDENLQRYLQYVMVKIALNPSAFKAQPFEETRPILQELIDTQGLRLRLSYLGVTGLAYLEADIIDPEQHEPLPIGWEPRTFYVPSAPSTLSRLEDSVNDVISALQTDFFPILENIKSASEDFPELTDRLNTTLAHVNTLLEGQKYNLAEILDNFRLISRDLEELLATLKRYPSQLMFGEQPPQVE